MRNLWLLGVFVLNFSGFSQEVRHYFVVENPRVFDSLCLDSTKSIYLHLFENHITQFCSWRIYLSKKEFYEFGVLKSDSIGTVNRFKVFKGEWYMYDLGEWKPFIKKRNDTIELRINNKYYSFEVERNVRFRGYRCSLIRCIDRSYGCSYWFNDKLGFIGADVKTHVHQVLIRYDVLGSEGYKLKFFPGAGNGNVRLFNR